MFYFLLFISFCVTGSPVFVFSGAKVMRFCWRIMIFLDFRLKSVRQKTDFTTDGAHTPKICRKRGADEGKEGGE
ncbi:MAG: hypothetical protein IKR05_10680, partial [Prevotella sp.]|nr:hypothetical protein [Prevotella sp.]